MRWLLVDPHDHDEAARREAVIRRIDRWWNEFSDRRDELRAFFSGSESWPLAEWMQDTLQAIDPNLMWEFGPALHHPGGYRLVITPETQRHLRPLVNEILTRAPSLEGWEFYGHRQPESLSDVVETVRGLCGGDITKAVVHARHDGHQRIALTYYTPECAQKTLDEQQVHMAVYVATESLLGEAVLDRWIGTIEVLPFSSDKPRGDSSRAVPFARLGDTVGAIVGSLIDQLPEEPSYAFVPQGKWNSYELQPEAAYDFPGRSDLCVAISGRPDVFEGMHSGSAFYSDTHTRAGETFCYLKIDVASEPMSIRSRLREEIETAIDKVLVPAKLGCVIGGGTGLRYSYVDLGLTEVGPTLNALRQLGQRGLFPRRSWLHFCDDELAAEWASLVPNAPHPPGLEDD